MRSTFFRSKEKLYLRLLCLFLRELSLQSKPILRDSPLKLRVAYECFLASFLEMIQNNLWGGGNLYLYLTYSFLRNIFGVSCQTDLEILKPQVRDENNCFNQLYQMRRISTSSLIPDSSALPHPSHLNLQHGLYLMFFSYLFCPLIQQSAHRTSIAQASGGYFLPIYF